MVLLKLIQWNYKIISNILPKRLISYRSSTKMPATPQLQDEKNIVWIDLEMTGLDIKRDRILEIACLITDKDLNIIAEGPNLIINQSQELLNGMNEWCVRQHGESGLTNASLNSNLTDMMAESEIIEFISKYTVKGKNCLGGNSIYMDRLFLNEHMPELGNYLHYRLIDVSTVKELCRRWNSQIYYRAPKKTLTHRAMDDIKESIQELKYYKDFMFNS